MTFLAGGSAVDEEGEGEEDRLRRSVRTSCEGLTRHCGVSKVLYGQVVNGVDGAETFVEGLFDSSVFMLTSEKSSYSVESSLSVFMKETVVQGGR